MIADNSMSASFLMRKLCNGNFEMFSRALAALTKSSHGSVRLRLVEAPSTTITGLWEKAALGAAWLPLACAAASAVLQVDKNPGRFDAEIYRRNIVDRTMAILKAEGHVLTDSQRNFFRTL
jgi:hypothetical protein